MRWETLRVVDWDWLMGMGCGNQSLCRPIGLGANVITVVPEDSGFLARVYVRARCCQSPFCLICHTGEWWCTPKNQPIACSGGSGRVRSSLNQWVESGQRKVPTSPRPNPRAANPLPNWTCPSNAAADSHVTTPLDHCNTTAVGLYFTV